MWSRRGMLAAAGATAVAGALAGCSEKVNKAFGFAQRMVEIQQRHGGRIGVSALIGDGGAASGTLSIQSDDRFAHCSTFKWVLAAAILQGVDQGKFKLGQMISYGKKDLLDYAPVTTEHVAEGRMSLGDLCAAMVEVSDNTAANLVLPLVGGPAGLTAFVRGLGDTETRFDRTEPDLNSNIDKDPRDTTTPAAMSELLRMVFTGTVLKTESLAQLRAWMIACTTGAKRIRASVPAGWIAGDKTGTGENGAVNDVAVIWPPKGSAIFLSIYTSGGKLDDDGRNKVVADIAKLVFDTLGFIETLDTTSASSSS